MQVTRLLTKQAASPARSLRDALRFGGAPSARLLTHQGRDRQPSVQGVAGQPTVEWQSSRVLLRRIGKCLTFGCNPQQTADAAALVRTIVNTWPGILASLAACDTRECLVYKGPLSEGVERSPEGSRPPWQSIGRHTQLVRVAQEAAVRFLDYTLATAAPKIGSNGSNFEMKMRSVPQAQNVSACIRLDSYESFEERGDFTLKVFIWSHKHLAKIAEATLLVNYDQEATPKMKPFLRRELERMAALGWDPAAYDRARQERDAILSAVDKLDKDTWDRDDAVEDFGSASSS
ncbi:thioesterase/thiol ester dehydrase-isomerase protein [Colletotrichum tofieldiae]|nr:thioesterase/thiol ester dehydrase-isomerase protein [Colletotrichum tofieldiae]